MAESSGGNNSADDLLWGVVGTLILIGLIWYFFRAEISLAMLVINDYKLRFIELFVSSGPDDRLTHIRHWVNHVNPSDATFSSLMGLSKATGQFFMIPVAVIILYWAYQLYKSPTYTRKMGSRALVESERELWPEISVAMMHDILQENGAGSKWAPSRDPVKFIEHFKLLDRNDNLNKDKATKVLAKQLGKPYKSPRSLSAYERALAGCFAAAIADNKPAAEDALDKMNLSYDGKRVNPAAGLALFERYFDEPVVQEIVRRHYYCNTLLYSLLTEARARSGVLPSSLFLWLKPLNRHKWYVLNNVGRRVAWADVCGTFNHYLAERVHQAPIKKPFVSNAVEGLEIVSKTRLFSHEAQSH